MALTQPKTIFGIHSFAPYSRTSGEFFGIAKILGNGTFSMTSDSIKLFGGSQKFAWASESGNIDANISLLMREYPDFIFELFLGKKPTNVAASATGSIDSYANKKGTSIKNATNGIDVISATVGDESDLKFGKYVIKALSANTFDVFLSTDADFNRGTAGDYLSDLLKINSAPLDVSTADAVLANYGLTFEKVGTPAFVTGDTATFYVLPINNGSMSVKIGGAADTFQEFGAIMLAQKNASGELFEIEVFKAQGGGSQIGGNEKAFSETTLTASCSYDSVEDAVAKFRSVK